QYEGADYKNSRPAPTVASLAAGAPQFWLSAHGAHAGDSIIIPDDYVPRLPMWVPAGLPRPTRSSRTAPAGQLVRAETDATRAARALMSDFPSLERAHGRPHVEQLVKDMLKEHKERLDLKGRR
ncbi:MAG: hypothetical protein LQ350_008588, partial [Teloschistes chrysophthalmus]